MNEKVPRRCGAPAAWAGAGRCSARPACGLGGFWRIWSPVLIPAERPVGGVGIEVGFFVSQGAVVVAAVAIVLALRKRSVAVGRGVLLCAPRCSRWRARCFR
ncbi:MAG: hypothetical protein ACLUW6_01450 [Coriobacteriaceae bacterium]